MSSPSNSDESHTKKILIKKLTRSRLFFFSLLSMLFIGSYLVLIPWLTEDFHMSSNTNDSSNYVIDKSNAIDVVGSVKKFDTRNMTLEYQMNFVPGPESSLGIYLGTTSIIAQGKDFVVYVDDLNSNITHQFRAFSMNTPINAAVNAKAFAGADISKYPLDSYYGEVLIRSKFVKDWDTYPLSVNELVSPNLIHQYAFGVNPPDGLQVAFIRIARASVFDETKTFDQVEIQDDISKGFYYTVIMIQRNNIVKFSVFLLSVLFTIIPVISIMLLRSVYTNKRPPTLSTLVWSNSLVFTVIVTRFSLPQNPPIGINLDKFLVFPAIILTTLASLGHVIFWVKKENYIPK